MALRADVAAVTVALADSDEAGARPVSSVVSRSVERAFSLFALFAELRRPLGTKEIRGRLAIPQQSAHALLKDLVQQGWLAFDPAAQTYFPTLAFGRLGDWLEPALLASGPYVRYLDALAAASVETVSLATATSGLVEVLDVRLGSATPAVALRPGLGSTLTESATGAALLAQMPAEVRREHLRRLVGSASAVAPANAEAVATFEHAFARGAAAAAYDLLLAGIGVVAIDLPPLDPKRPVVAVLAGFSERVRSAEATLAARMAELRAAIWDTKN